MRHARFAAVLLLGLFPAGCVGIPPAPPPESLPETPSSAWSRDLGDDRMSASLSARGFAESYGPDNTQDRFTDELTIRLGLLGEDVEAARLTSDLEVVATRLGPDLATGGRCLMFGADYGTSYSGGFESTEARRVTPLETVRLGPETIALAFDVTVRAEVGHEEVGGPIYGPYDGISVDERTSTAVEVSVSATVASGSGVLLENRMVGPGVAVDSRTTLERMYLRRTSSGESRTFARLTLMDGAGREEFDTLAAYGSEAAEPIAFPPRDLEYVDISSW